MRLLSARPPYDQPPKWVIQQLLPPAGLSDAGFTASYMETLLMGPERIEVLSTRPRELTVL